MSSTLTSPLFRSTRARRRVLWVLVAATLFAGIAQAAHFHPDELTGAGSGDVHCLLCLYAAGSATPSAPIRPPAPPPRPQTLRGAIALPIPRLYDAASYDARGPPLA